MSVQVKSSVHAATTVVVRPFREGEEPVIEQASNGLLVEYDPEAKGFILTLDYELDTYSTGINVVPWVDISGVTTTPFIPLLIHVDGRTKALALVDAEENELVASSFHLTLFNYAANGGERRPVEIISFTPPTGAAA